MPSDYFTEARLSRAEQVLLYNAMKSSSWQVMLDILEQCCQIAETEHLQLDPKSFSSDQIARSHAETRGQRLLFERFQAKMGIEVKAAMQAAMAEAPPEDAQEPTDEELAGPYRA